MEWNSRVHPDRAIVEIFGRMKGYFDILATSYRGTLDALEDVVITCICLANFLLKANPLCSGEEREESSTKSDDSDMSTGFETSSKRAPKDKK